jgi:hypothetical protein
MELCVAYSGRIFAKANKEFIENFRKLEIVARQKELKEETSRQMLLLAARRHLASLRIDSRSFSRGKRGMAGQMVCDYFTAETEAREELQRRKGPDYMVSEHKRDKEYAKLTGKDSGKIILDEVVTYHGALSSIQGNDEDAGLTRSSIERSERPIKQKERPSADAYKSEYGKLSPGSIITEYKIRRSGRALYADDVGRHGQNGRPGAHYNRREHKRQ